MNFYLFLALVGSFVSIGVQGQSGGDAKPALQGETNPPFKIRFNPHYISKGEKTGMEKFIHHLKGLAGLMFLNTTAVSSLVRSKTGFFHGLDPSSIYFVIGMLSVVMLTILAYAYFIYQNLKHGNENEETENSVPLVKVGKYNNLENEEEE